MKPQDTLKAVDAQLKKMQEMKTKYVAVGVLASEATGRIYENGVNVLQVAAIHEYGLGPSPERSFLRAPQELRQKELKNFINIQLEKVLDGRSVSQGLGLIGVYAVNLSQQAFDTSGFGSWPALSSSTINSKGSSKPLIDTGTLKNSVTWEIR